jgi:hypothetical protein
MQLPLQGAQPVQGEAGADLGGGPLQIAAGQVGAGQVGLEEGPAADLPGLDTSHSLGDQLGRGAGLAGVAQAAAEIRGERVVGVEAQAGWLLAGAGAFVVAFGLPHGAPGGVDVAEQGSSAPLRDVELGHQKKGVAVPWTTPSPARASAMTWRALRSRSCSVSAPCPICTVIRPICDSR